MAIILLNDKQEVTLRSLFELSKQCREVGSIEDDEAVYYCTKIYCDANDLDINEVWKRLYVV